MHSNNNNGRYYNSPRRPSTSTDWSNEPLRRLIAVNGYYHHQQPNYSSIASCVPSAPLIEDSLPPPYTDEMSNHNHNNNSPKHYHRPKHSPHYHGHHSHHKLNARAMPVANYRQWEVNQMIEPTPLPPSTTVRFVIVVVIQGEQRNYSFFYFIISSEFTPLLENFTKKFMESQTHAYPNSTQSRLASQELLYVYQKHQQRHQQAAFNPDLEDSYSDMSMDSSFEASTMDTTATIPANANGLGGAMPTSKLGSRLYLFYNAFSWYFVNLTLLVSLMSFSAGMLIQPGIYAIFLALFRAGRKKKTSYVTDLLIIGSMQLVVSIVTTICGLVLLYATCRTLDILRRRLHGSYQQYHPKSVARSIFAWFIITYEHIVAETLGTFFSRLLALLMVVYLFLSSLVYILLVKDMFDMLLASLKLWNVEGEFCEHRWWLNHDLITTVWLLTFTLLIVGIKSLHTVTRRLLQRIFSFAFIKRCATLVGFVFVIYFTFFVVYVYVNAVGNEQHLSKFNRSQLYIAPTPTTTSNGQHQSMELNWFLIIASLPLLVMPFHMHELIIFILFSNANHSAISRTTKWSRTNSIGKYPAMLDDRQIIYESNIDKREEALPPQLFVHRQQQNYGTVPLQPPLPSAPPVESSMATTAAATPFFRQISDDLVFKVWSFRRIRNLFIAAWLVNLVLNVSVNALAYLTSYRHQHDSKTNNLHQDTILPPSSIASIELNFLVNYFHTNRTSDEDYYLLVVALVLLLLKTSFTYLLLTFRGLLAYQHLTGNDAAAVSTAERSMMTSAIGVYGEDQRLRSGLCSNGLMFITPFFLWNCLVLLGSIALEVTKETFASLHLIILAIGWLSIFLLFIYPALLLIYLSWQSTRKRRGRARHGHGGLWSRAVRFPKFSFILGLAIFAVGLSSLVTWIYAYDNDDAGLISLVPSVNLPNASDLFCSS